MSSLFAVPDAELVSRYTVAVYASTRDEDSLRAWRFAAGDTTSYEVALAAQQGVLL